VSASALAIGRAFLVRGYYTGDFIGRGDSLGPNLATFTVLDTLRPPLKVQDRCPFPGCVALDSHGGDHELAPIRLGEPVQIFWKNASYVAVDALEQLHLSATLDPWSAAPSYIHEFRRSTRDKIPSARRAKCASSQSAAGGPRSSSSIA
jgi:hypothetical protein